MRTQAQKAAKAAAAEAAVAKAAGLPAPQSPAVTTSQLSAPGEQPGVGKASESGKQFRAAPLRLDGEGREVDEFGKVIERPEETTMSSLKVRLSNSDISIETGSLYQEQRGG